MTIATNQSFINTVCPVCGMKVDGDAPLIELCSRRTGQLAGIRFCCDDCAAEARRSPDRYIMAAQMDSVA